MADNYLVKIFEHNNWANLQIIQACSVLSAEQLDAEPRSVTKGSIRLTLRHLVGSQQNYLRLLTGAEPRFNLEMTSPFSDFQEAARFSGEKLLAVARGDPSVPVQANIQTRDGYHVEPWVLLVQAINHADEHREQICSMLTDLGVTPPDLDGWTFGEASNALVPLNQ